MTITTEEAERLAVIWWTQTMGGIDYDRYAGTATALRSLAAERDALNAENARLREALRFYAGDEPWRWNSEDFGDKARAALGEKE